jgi:hypothetical protein
VIVTWDSIVLRDAVRPGWVGSSGMSSAPGRDDGLGFKGSKRLSSALAPACGLGRSCNGATRTLGRTAGRVVPADASKVRWLLQRHARQGPTVDASVASEQ